jgi:hypothetical protein
VEGSVDDAGNASLAMILSAKGLTPCRAMIREVFHGRWPEMGAIKQVFRQNVLSLPPRFAMMDVPHVRPGLY